MAIRGDGKIRLQCSGCGKRVKFPEGQPGQAYRCPICHTTIVSPLNGDDIHLPSTQELKSFAGKITPKHGPHRVNIPLGNQESKGIKARRNPGMAQRPKGVRARRHPVERLGSFISQENQRITQQSCEILTDRALSDKDQMEKLQALRQSKGVRLKQYVLALHKDADKRILALRNSAAADTPSNKQNIAGLEAQREQLRLYVKVMFQFQTPG